jgi:two-component system chemotaxis response regulator CheY
MAASEVFDMVITDVNMPVMDGLTLTRNLRKLPAYQRVPMIALTTEAAADVKRAGRDAGATAWVLKPFNPQRLVDAVAALLV